MVVNCCCRGHARRSGTYDNCAHMKNIITMPPESEASVWRLMGPQGPADPLAGGQAPGYQRPGHVVRFNNMVIDENIGLQ